jgi:uracil-DNA glycosylase family 4
MAALPFSSITQVHGKFYDTVLLGRRTTIFPAFHPASALYSAKYKRKLTIDFRLLGQQLRKMGIAHR